jgi:Protein kinase domain/WD domain, G-beta repeat
MDETCDRFEAAWRAGDRPLIEDYFGGTTALDRPVLLRHLLDLELAYCASLGECPEPSEYRHRFPGNEVLIDSIFAEFVDQTRLVHGGDLQTVAWTGLDGARSGAPPSPPPDYLRNVPGVEILSELGRGGMGVVYKARQIRLNRICALKVTLPGERDSAEFRARFLAEAETIAKLRHPNIVQIYGLGDHEGRPYFEMEYIEGGSLARRLDGTPWAPGRAARMVVLLARAIGAAHRAGIVHRDLKPANVLLVDDDTPKAKGFPLRVNHPVQSVTFGEDGRRLLIGSTLGAHWWQLNGQSLYESDQWRDDDLNRGLSSRVEATALSPNRRTLATARSLAAEGRARGRLELWDAASVKILRQTSEQPYALSGVVYSPDSKWILTWGPSPGTAVLWDVADLRESRHLFRSLASPIRQVAFSADGRRLLLGCRDGKARLWDLERDAEIDCERGPRHAYPITAVAFDPTRARVVTGCHAGTVRVWDAARGTILRELRQNAGEIVVLAFSPDGKTFVTASDDGTARFVDAESGAPIGPALHHTDAVLCVAFAPDGQSVVTGTRDGVVQLWTVPLSPKTGGIAEVRRWLKEQTGMELDDQGAVMMGRICN